MEEEKLQMDESASTQTESAQSVLRSGSAATAKDEQDKVDKSDEAKKEAEKSEEKDKPKGEDSEKLKAELKAREAELAQKEREVELYKERLEDVLIRTAILAEAKSLLAQDPELIYLILRSACEIRQTNDGGYEIVVKFENRPNESKLEIEELELPKAIAKLLDKYPYMCTEPKDKGSGSESSTFAPLTLESVKTLSVEELLARKGELESLAKRLLG